MTSRSERLVVGGSDIGVGIGESSDIKENKTSEPVKFDFKEGSDSASLYDLLQGYDTGWDLDGEGGVIVGGKLCGNLRVYCTVDEEGKSIPRVAIRFNKEVHGVRNIVEVMGRGNNRELESDMVEFANQEFPKNYQWWDYEQQRRDTKLLGDIESKNKNNQPLTREDLKFLYEMSEEIHAFGMRNFRSRIPEIIASRNVVNDYNEIFREVEVWEGDLFAFYVKSGEGLVLPKRVTGSLIMINLTSAKGVVFPEFLGGSMKFFHLDSAEELFPSKDIEGSVIFNHLNSPKGLDRFVNIGRDLYIHSLGKVEELQFSPNISIKGEVLLNEYNVDKIRFGEVERRNPSVNFNFF